MKKATKYVYNIPITEEQLNGGAEWVKAHKGTDIVDGVFISRWIPVSEGLPKKNVWVLVTVEQSGIRYQDIMRRNNYREAWTDDIDNYTDEVIAWMPLPEPYKVESEDKAQFRKGKTDEKDNNS